MPSSHTMSDLQEKEAASAGLKINGGKWKQLSLTGSVIRIVKVAGVQIETVDRFTYLGSCHIETASFHQSLPKQYFPYLLAKSYYKC